jgi:aromatase
VSDEAGRVLVHRHVADAPAATLYGLVADVSRWPVVFGPSLYVEHLERGERDERFRLWATVAGEVKTWTSRRTLDEEDLRITFRQERSQSPIASMGGSWTFHPLSDHRTEIVLTHEFTATAGGQVLDDLSAAVDRNSTEELAALARIAELGHPPEEVVYSFEDTFEFDGAAEDGYAFIHRSDLWPDRLPHVDRVVLREDVPGVQDMEMDTVTADGSTHTTKSVRICFPHQRIVYKQLLPPALLFGHSGAWSFEDRPEGGAVITARHTVAINPAAVATILGPDVTLPDARRYVREALGGNGKSTMAHAGAHARQAAGRTTGTSG